MTVHEWNKFLGRRSCAWYSGSALHLCENKKHPYPVPCTWSNCPIAQFDINEENFSVSGLKMKDGSGAYKEWRCRTNMTSGVELTDYMHPQKSLSEVIDYLLEMSPTDNEIVKINLKHVE